MNGPYKIGTLARLTGFSPALLRAWERRFGLIVPERGAGHQRVYGDADLLLLNRVRTLIDEGRAIGEIARLGRQGLMAGVELTDAAGSASAVAPSVGAAALRRRIVTAALALDARAMSTALDETFAVLAAERAVADVIEPAAVEIGDLWKAGRCSVAGEHLASDQFLHRLGRLLDAAQPPGADALRVVAACFPDEHHQLGLRIVAWHLARHGVRVIYLGAAMPPDDLARTCRRSQPRAILLSVTRRSVFTRYHRDIVRLLPGSAADRLFIGGQGVPPGTRSSDRRFVFMPDTPLASVINRIVAELRSGR